MLGGGFSHGRKCFLSASQIKPDNAKFIAFHRKRKTNARFGISDELVHVIETSEYIPVMPVF